ncbi:MAG: hypothetical protein CVT94_15955 [Bacteroidetes bacterium HGW-Bacteroidetes-11]|jgi:hypothetical protein|nr:MAG: hypothetical protein CVT94_15955 [Bacteroidetes bacterium HGW-Bacteroidetes-11]
MAAMNPFRSINAIAMISREVGNQNLTPSEFARMINRHPSTITVMMKQKDLAVNKLISCSAALKYNFFQEIAYQLQYPGPPDPNIKSNPLAMEAAALNQEVLKLKGEIKSRDAEIGKLNSQLQEAGIDRRILETELNTIKQIMKDMLASNRI